MTTIDWRAWRSEFPSCSKLVHMNHAGISPLPRRVSQALHDFADEALLLDPAVYPEWERRVERARSSFARLIGAEASELAFVRNTSEGLSLIAGGLEWSQGDNVVGLSDEYPSNVYPWWGLRRFGVEVRLLDRPTSRFGVDDIRRLVDSGTRVLAVSAVDWQSGFRANLADLGAFCRERGILFCVDGIQAVGALDMDVRGCGIDCMAMGGHKWLLAPEGCGTLFVSKRVVERFHPPLLGWKSVTDSNRYLPYHFDLRDDAARFEPGTESHVGVRALGAAVDLLLEIGSSAIEARVLELARELGEGLRRLGAELVSPWETGERSGIVTFRLGDTKTLVGALAEAGVIARPRLGGVRLAPHFYNDEDDISLVLDVVGTHQRSM
jgi:cysteine desulfurase/selenocysteine lyase